MHPTCGTNFSWDLHLKKRTVRAEKKLHLKKMHRTCGNFFNAPYMSDFLSALTKCTVREKFVLKKCTGRENAIDTIKKCTLHE